MERENLTFHPSGDNGILILFDREISIETHNRIRSYIFLLNKHNDEFKEIIEIIPAYTSLLIIYEPSSMTYGNLLNKLQKLEGRAKNILNPPIEIVHIPVLYGGVNGPDIEYVAQHNGLTIKEVVDIHINSKYLIYMMGFTPGFPYLGGMSPKIATPRLEIPREKIMAGSVGIAGNQTGVYPIESPGGWQIIGRSPLKLFDPNSKEVTLLRAGQYIQFFKINEKEFDSINKEVKENTYIVKKTTLKEAETNV